MTNTKEVPDVPDNRYQVVVQGTGPRTGTVASSPMTREDAAAGLPTVLEVFAADIAAGELEVSVLPVDGPARLADVL